MKTKAFGDQIVTPALRAIGLDSDSAVNLLVGTALVESSLLHLVQIGGGPGKSFYQVEGATYLDCKRYLLLYRNRDLYERVLSACYLDHLPDDDDILIWNMRLATIIARIKYYMQPEALPHARDFIGLARYHKVYFNSSLGATDTSKSIKYFEEACK